jgi:hypothetical protein
MAKLVQEPRNVLYRIKRGLSGYVSYLAAGEMNEAFSEYVLYEPILRILSARRYDVACEYPCPGIEHARRGDRRRIDFYAFLTVGNRAEFALEVKWAKTARPRLAGDIEKLRAFLTDKPNADAFVCVFGTRSVLETLEVDDALIERGDAVYANFGTTRIGCRIYQLGRKGA